VGHQKKVHSLAWNCTGTRLASGSGDRTAKIWSADSQFHMRETAELRGHNDSVDQLCWDPTNPDRLATASGDKTVRLWDAREKGKPAYTIPTSGENINIAYSPDGLYIAVGNKDDCLSIIDTRRAKVFKRTQFKYEVNEFSWDVSGKYFFLTTGQSSGMGTVEVMDFKRESVSILKSIPAHTGHCYCMDVDPNGRYIAVGSADAMVSVWDLEDLMCVQTFSRLDWPIRTVSFSHDGNYVAAGSEDLFIDIANVATGEHHSVPTKGATNCIAWHPNKLALAYACEKRDREGAIKLLVL